ISANEGWIGGASGLSSYAPSFLHTVDGGETWSPAGFNNTYLINRIRFLNPALGYASGANVYKFSLPLVISEQPQSQVVKAGEDVNLHVTAYGNGTLNYRWQKNGTDLYSATNSTLLIQNAHRGEAGTYDVIVTNTVASVQSSDALVQVIAAERLAQPIVLP